MTIDAIAEDGDLVVSEVGESIRDYVELIHSLVGGGKKVLEVSFREDDSFALYSNDFAIAAVPDVDMPDETSFETPIRIEDRLEVSPLSAEIFQPVMLASGSQKSVAAITPSLLQETLSSSGSVEDAVDQITGELDAKLQSGDLLVVWLLDSSNSLVDDRQRVAARLAPYYEKLAGSHNRSQHVLQSAVVSYGALMRERVAPTEFGNKIFDAVEDLPVDRSGKEQVFGYLDRLWDQRSRHYA